jgi:hypothetical protein
MLRWQDLDEVALEPAILVSYADLGIEDEG